MKRQDDQKTNTRQRASALALMLGAGIALSGCQEGTQPFAFLKNKPAEDQPTDAAAPQQTTKLVERDVEAPQVFSVEEDGLWDGRPSLGGVWVAHPGVKDPERVIIRNLANGKFVIGALFRRESDNPGPKLQVSSDAADALGMLAGAPAKLSVVALRRETAPAALPAPAEAPAADKAATGKNETIEQTSLGDLKSTASKAIAAAETASTATGTKPQAKPVKAAPAKTTAIGAPPEPGPAPAPPVADSGSMLKSTTGMQYVQIGIFSVEANAKRAQEQMAKAGVIASVVKETSHTKTFWRVVAGPVPSKSDLKALEDKVHALGYPDAYAVSN